MQSTFTGDSVRGRPLLWDWIICTGYFALSTLYLVLWAGYSVLDSLYWGLCTWYFALGTLRAVARGHEGPSRTGRRRGGAPKSVLGLGQEKTQKVAKKVNNQDFRMLRGAISISFGPGRRKL